MKIPVANVTLGEEEAEAVAAIVRSGRLSSGPKVKEFEGAFCDYTGARHAIAVNNGTAALHLILAALGVGPGDEVVCPSLTFIATANAVLYQGATPVLCECDGKTYNVTGDIIRARVTERTKAIIPVEMNGLPVDYDDILSQAKELGIPVVMDSAESLGAAYKGRKVGSIASLHCFSFFPNKIITTGEGGMITTDDDELQARMRRILNQGQDYRYHHVVLGYNYRMTEIQAALGLTQLKRIETLLDEKERIARRYTAAFASLKGVRPPHVPPYATRHSWYMYSVQVSPMIRDAVVAELNCSGIETRLSFPPVHIQPFYQEKFGFTPDDLPITHRAWAGKIDLPVWPGIGEVEQNFVIEKLLAAVTRCSKAGKA